jgi:hypothetical protein
VQTELYDKVKYSEVSYMKKWAAIVREAKVLLGLQYHGAYMSVCVNGRKWMRILSVKCSECVMFVGVKHGR